MAINVCPLGKFDNVSVRIVAKVISVWFDVTDLIVSINTIPSPTVKIYLLASDFPFVIPK